MKRVRTRAAWLMIWLSCVLAGVPALAVAPPAVPTSPPLRAQAGPAGVRNLQVFDAVWSAIKEDYYDGKFNGVDLDASRREYRDRAATAADERGLYRVVNEMLARFRDRHLYAASPSEVIEERRRIRTGIGMAVSVLEGRVVVTDVQTGSPAEKAGLRRGWILTHWDGDPVDAKVIDTRRAARLAEGQAARLRFLDGRDQVVHVTVTARPHARFAENLARRIEDDVLYVRFDLFGPRTGKWLREQLDTHKQTRALVVDLRRNVGGAVDSLRDSLDTIFSADQIVGDFKERSGRNQRFRIRGRGTRAFTGPVAVLIGGDSGSAAEIFASVVQESGRGTVVGRTSAGAVLASVEKRLPDGGVLYLSIRDYVSARGRRLEGRGVAPSVDVALTLEDLRKGRDLDLERALEALPKAKRSPVEARGADGRL